MDHYVDRLEGRIDDLQNDIDDKDEAGKDLINAIQKAGIILETRNSQIEKWIIEANGKQKA